MTISLARTIQGITLLAILVGHDSMLAQGPRWNAPSTVFLHDSVGKTIRPLVGVVGSSYPGPILMNHIDWASFALNHKSALVTRAGVLAWIPNLSDPDLDLNFSAHTLVDAPLPQQVFWAANSSQAVMLSAGPPRLVWLGHFDGSPGLEASWDLDSSQTTWRLLAVDSSARQALLASQAGEVWRLWLASPTNAPVLIAGINRPGAAVFASSGTSAFVADAAIHQVLQVSALSSNPVLAPLAIEVGYVADPVAIALSKDGSRLFLADGTGKIIRVFETGTGLLITELPLQTAPLSLTAISPSSFLLGGRDSKDQPFFLLDTQANGRVFFIPVGQ